MKPVCIQQARLGGGDARPVKNLNIRVLRTDVADDVIYFFSALPELGHREQ